MTSTTIKQGEELKPTPWHSISSALMHTIPKDGRPDYYTVQITVEKMFPTNERLVVEEQVSHVLKNLNSQPDAALAQKAALLDDTMKLLKSYLAKHNLVALPKDVAEELVKLWLIWNRELYCGCLSHEKLSFNNRFADCIIKIENGVLYQMENKSNA